MKINIIYSTSTFLIICFFNSCRSNSIEIKDQNKIVFEDYNINESKKTKTYGNTSIEYFTKDGKLNGLYSTKKNDVVESGSFKCSHAVFLFKDSVFNKVSVD